MERNIRVVHICDKFGVSGSSVHGVSRLFSWWFPRFDQERFGVKLVGLRQPDDAVAHLQKQGIDVVSLCRSKFDPLTVRDIVRLIRRERPDILHLHGYGATNFGRIAASLTNTRTIVHEHFVDPAMPRYQIPIDRALSRFTDYGIAVSHSVKEFMVRQRYVPADKTEVIFNGAPLQEFKPLSDKEIGRERERWNIPRGNRVVATIGRLDTQKGNRYFIEAAAIILGHRTDVTFMLVGDGPLMHELRTLCRQRGIERHVIFTGYASNVPHIQSLVDIQVFPSLWEGTPLTVFEAMSMQRAIVSTWVDGLGEVLHHDENALLVPPGRADELATAILTLLAEPGRARQLAARAERDSRAYSIQKTVDRIQRVYERLAHSVGSAPHPAPKAQGAPFSAPERD